MSDNLNYTVCWQALLLVLSVLTVPSTAQQDAGNISLIEGSVELVGGEINGTGNIIIYHLGAWGIVCDDGWNLAGAHVVCRSLGYPAALGHTTQAYFGAVEQTQNVIMDDVQCHGDEGGLLDCQHSEWGVHDCDPREAAGVFCAPRDANAVPGRGTYAPTPSPVSVTSTASPSSSPSPRATDDSGNVLLMKKALKLQKEAHQRHKHVHNPEPYDIRLVNGRNSNEGRVEVNIDGKWGVICSDHWSLLEATVVCQQKGLGYANMAVQTNSFGGESLDKLISGLHCDGEEDHLAECYHEHVSDDVICSAVTMVAGVVCSPVLPDLVPNATLLLHSSYLEDRPMVYMQCAMEEGCASASAYTIKEKQYDWQMTRRRLLRFSSSTWNFGTAEFRPYLPKNHWEWHDCHMHYHSMSVFAHYDILDEHGNRSRGSQGQLLPRGCAMPAGKEQEVPVQGICRSRYLSWLCG